MMEEWEVLFSINLSDFQTPQLVLKVFHEIAG